MARSAKRAPVVTRTATPPRVLKRRTHQHVRRAERQRLHLARVAGTADDHLPTLAAELRGTRPFHRECASWMATDDPAEQRRLLRK